MSSDDWLVGDRHSAARARILDAASVLIARHGWHGLDLDVLAAEAHCSRATIYRHVGGKTEIRNGVLTAAIDRVADAVRLRVDGLTGGERAVEAVLTALDEVRADLVGDLAIRALARPSVATWLIGSPLLATYASEFTGSSPDDAEAAQWTVRVFLSLLTVPVGTAAGERALVKRFLRPAYDG
ncbi:TetR/AcrR family transcriptional regulator [Mycobacterium sp. smrl_JER01]|uniref:TetR/AcrR family transcriptional regulator n=1 Tax=Mycobacterium sp. smrl_JER01 TaxID=3402633 RepID=UPI003ACDE88B